MTEQYYDLTFKGDLIDGFFTDFVKADLQALFKTSSAKVDQWFNGSEHQIKLKVDKATAVKFQQGFKKAGAKLIVKRHNPELITPAQLSSPASPQRAQPKLINEEVSTTTSFSTALGATDGSSVTVEVAQHQAAIDTPTSVPSWNVSAEGSMPTEQATEKPIDIDTSSLTLAEAGANLVLADGFEAPAPVINTDKLSLAEVGGTIDTLKDQKEPVTVDISHLQIDPS